MIFSAKFYSKIWILHEFTLKEGPKVKMENFIGTKSWRKILEGLKRKVGIFIRTKNIFNPCSYSDLDLPDDCWEKPLLGWFTRFLNKYSDLEEDNCRYYLKSLSLVSKHLLSITNRHKLFLRICHPTLPFLPCLFRRFTNLTSLDFSHLLQWLQK